MLLYGIILTLDGNLSQGLNDHLPPKKEYILAERRYCALV